MTFLNVDVSILVHIHVEARCLFPVVPFPSIDTGNIFQPAFPDPRMHIHEAFAKGSLAAKTLLRYLSYNEENTCLDNGDTRMP